MTREESIAYNQKLDDLHEAQVKALREFHEASLAGVPKYEYARLRIASAQAHLEYSCFNRQRAA